MTNIREKMRNETSMCLSHDIAIHHHGVNSGAKGRYYEVLAALTVKLNKDSFIDTVPVDDFLNSDARDIQYIWLLFVSPLTVPKCIGPIFCVFDFILNIIYTCN